MWTIGLGKADITVYEPGMWMFGWGMPENLSLGVAMPLHARALVVEDGDGRVATVVCDLGFISQSVRQAVVDRVGALGLDEHRLLLSATHTHSGPNGYSHYMFYAATAPGFSARVHDGIVDGIVAALRQAVARLAPGRARLAMAELPVSEGIATNRSLAAYNRNSDVTPLPPERAGEAVNRRMVVLRLEDAAGRPRGLVSWFPLHGTCIHADNTLLHPDHKGVAAAWCEDAAARGGVDDFVALFAQEAAGDVTPNLAWDPRRRLMAGPGGDDAAHVAHVGATQGRFAWGLLHAAAGTPPLSGAVTGAVRYVDLATQPADPRFAGGLDDVGGAPARAGLAFAQGTAEGPGPLHGVEWLNRWLSAAVGRLHAGPDTPEWLRRQGAKYPWYDLGHGVNGKVLGFLSTMNLVLELVPERRVAWYRDTVKSGRLGALPWIPQVLPAQILRIGALTIAAVPQEPSTVAGRRLAAAVVRGPDETVVVNGYANAYAGYLVTPEEYDHQHYEAACTMFGRWSLPAWCTALSDVRDAMEQGAADLALGARPHRFGAADGLGPSRALALA
ncbi:MAG: neutral/alkaline non-lysosomal ceramidase N-terminal domain-containing protein [Pseudomonadota bacterium]|nr:neutral/alkaline non-lysosomal ceramidase N-terminal domain-containing protein [Pseudomonadota bacterium]